jgi:sugar (pentulose or hexulose) kinase
LVVILDVGKTLAKLTLWQRDGILLGRETRPNVRRDTGHYIALDADGIEAWMAEVLAGFSKVGPVDAIFPVGHGAAAAVIRNGRLACLPIDYEEPLPAGMRSAYEDMRDAFADTGSPALPDGLNLGAQLHHLETLYPDLLTGDAMILPWAQYWAWRLSGVAASEITSLACHSDLWRPAERTLSLMARKRGWAERIAPLTDAASVLGTLRSEWVGRTGLPAGVQIYCGIHDSNAALVAARGFPQIADHESTVLSTGTWFVAMRSPASHRAVDVASLPEVRDCLVNVDANGKLIPSSRFMGGREIEILTGLDTRRIDVKPDQAALIDALPAVLASGARVLPTFAPGFGPFPSHRGRWIDMPTDAYERRAAVSLYAALVADISLGLIGACERILVEGRFAEAEVFVRALATLRPNDAIYVSNVHNDVSYGALRLIDPGLKPASRLERVVPLDLPLIRYREAWSRDVARTEQAA